MTRFACLVWIVLASPLIAQPPTKDVNTVLGVQRAMAAAREHLRTGHAADAVRVLEAELLNADGNPSFLGLLQASYAEYLLDLERGQADAGAIQSVRQRLKAIEGSRASAGKGTEVGPSPMSEPAASVRAPAPPIPEPPAAPPTPAPDRTLIQPPAQPNAIAEDDPFQQVPRDAAEPAGDLGRASEAFAAKRYPQAAALFAAADRRKAPLSAIQKDEWAYCRLHAVAMQLNGRSPAPAELAELRREVDAAVRLGSARLQSFGRQLVEDLDRRGPATESPSTEGWQSVETASFRVLHRDNAELAAEVGRIGEAARRAMYERWAGPPAADWLPKCQVFLHPTGADYARATRKPAEHPGHSTVGTRGGQVVSRRIDLRADEAGMLDGILPHEVTQVLLAELFADQPLPRWAVVGMAALAETPESVARYQRAVPGLLREKKLFAVGPFLDRGEFPDASSVTAFYAESVSLVSYLVELKGPKAFTAFLREAPRRGYARALSAHYGFQDPADLQDKWVKHALGGE